MERTPRRQHLSPAAVRPDAGPADQRPAAAGVDRIGGGRSRPGCRNCPARGHRHPAAPPPTTRSGADLPRTGDAIDDITAALLDLDSSYLAVHGPPGTGKTFTAAQVITRLVNEHGWRVGVVAQSHAVVENLLRGTIDAGVDPPRVAKKRPTRRTSVAADRRERVRRIHRRHTRMRDRRYGMGFRQPEPCSAGQPRPAGDRRGRPVLPGQHHRRGPAAANLLLLGDPQQLPQVSQGTHPEPVDGSALGWLVEGHRTLPAERGYFLDRSYRMHPAVCAPVSPLSYDGRLQAYAEVTAARRSTDIRPGPGASRSPTTATPPRAPRKPTRSSTRSTAARLGLDDRRRHPAADAADVLVVTPYNAQVVLLRRLLAAAGLGDVRVGTVDKFQGPRRRWRIVSMTASSVDDVPRGIPFLLNRNRLNVAISRAQYAAVIVRADDVDRLPAGRADRSGRARRFPRADGTEARA